MIVFFVTVLISCENFMTGGKELKDEIRREVDHANAPTIQINVRPQQDYMGITSPLGITSVKLGIPFDIITTVNSGFGFTGWVQEGGLPGDIQFSDSSRTATQATVKRNSAGLGIRATFSDRPVVISSSPFDNEQAVIITRAIHITFSKPIDINSITPETVRVQHRFNGSTGPFTIINNHFAPPVVVDSTLILNLISGRFLGTTAAPHEVVVTLSTGVRDLNGLNKTAPRTFRFVTSTTADINPPTIHNLVVKNWSGVPLPTGNPVNNNNIIVDFETVDVESPGAPLTTQIRYQDDPPGQFLYNNPHTRNINLALRDQDGFHNLEITVTDPSGNPSILHSVSVIVDRVPPSSPAFIVGGTPVSPTRSVQFSVSTSDFGPSGDAGYWIVSGTAAPIFSSTGAFTGVVPNLQGNNTLAVVARDGAGNQSLPFNVVVFFDSIPPTIPVITGHNSPHVHSGVYYYQSGGVIFNFTSTDTASAIAGFTTDAGGSAPQSTLNLTSSATVYAVDSAGNVSPGRSITVIQDTTGPALGTLGAPTGPTIHLSGTTYFTTATTLSFNPSANDTGSGLAGYRINGGPLQTTLPLVLPAGTTYTITAVDNVGNTSAWPAFTITQDTVAPVRGALGAPTGPTIHLSGSTYFTTATTLSFNPTATDAGSGFAGYRINGGPLQTTLPLVLPAGTTYTITAVDTVGNTSAWPAFTITQDTVAPALGALGAPTGPTIHLSGSTYFTTATTLSFNPTATDAGSGFAGYRINGGPLQTTLPLILPAGTTYTITAVDTVGNTSAWPAFTITQDTAGPAIGPLSSGTGSYSLGFPLPVSDGLSGLHIVAVYRSDILTPPTWSSVSWAGNEVTGLSALDDGVTDYIRVIATDRVGNIREIVLERTRGTGSTSYTVTGPGGSLGPFAMMLPKNLPIGHGTGRGRDLVEPQYVPVRSQEVPIVPVFEAESNLAQQSRRAPVSKEKIHQESKPAVTEPAVHTVFIEQQDEKTIEVLSTIQHPVGKPEISVQRADSLNSEHQLPYFDRSTLLESKNQPVYEPPNDGSSYVQRPPAVGDRFSTALLYILGLIFCFGAVLVVRRVRKRTLF